MIRFYAAPPDYRYLSTPHSQPDPDPYNMYIFSFPIRLHSQVEPDFLIGFLDSCIESLKLSKEEDINGIITRNDMIEKLQERKRNVELQLKKKIQDNAKRSSSSKNSSTAESPVGNQNSSSSNNVDPFQPIKTTKKSLSSSAVTQVQPPQSQPMQESTSMQVLASKLDDLSMSSEVSGSDPTHTTTTSGDTSSEITTISRHDHRSHQREEKRDGGHAGNGEVVNGNNNNHHHHHHSTKSSEFEVSSETVYQIVDAVRQNTNLSHELSCVAFRTILSEMERIMPRKAVPYLNGIAVHLSSPLLAPDHLLGETHDARRLRAIFVDLADCKNDSEQRTWMLYEDEDDIIQYIQELTGILVRKNFCFCCEF